MGIFHNLVILVCGIFIGFTVLFFQDLYRFERQLKRKKGRNHEF